MDCNGLCLHNAIGESLILPEVFDLCPEQSEETVVEREVAKNDCRLDWHRNNAQDPERGRLIGEVFYKQHLGSLIFVKRSLILHHEAHQN